MLYNSRIAFNNNEAQLLFIIYRSVCIEVIADWCHSDWKFQQKLVHYLFYNSQSNHPEKLSQLPASYPFLSCVWEEYRLEEDCYSKLGWLPMPFLHETWSPWIWPHDPCTWRIFPYLQPRTLHTLPYLEIPIYYLQNEPVGKHPM